MDAGVWASAAAGQAASTGWRKIIGDWGLVDEPLPVDVLRGVVESVHEVGGTYPLT